jgi:glycosyltransferase involved in cell wall biosynthesis
MKTELIVATYNSPRALRLSLVGIAHQRLRPGSVCLADDGSGPETRAVIDTFAAEFPDLPVRHVWHPDTGFEKWAIVNRAIATSAADFLIFTDGDCLLHPGFIARHVELAHPRRFATGSMIRLPAEPTAAVTEGDVASGRVFDRAWLARVGAFDRVTTWLKASPLPRPLLTAFELVSPVRRTWCGANASAFRDAILAVNGFDETMKYGGGDKEFGIRLTNSGVCGRHLRYTAPVVHLDHARGYKDAARVAENRRKIAAARRQGMTWAADGIKRDPDANDAPRALVSDNSLFHQRI